MQMRGPLRARRVAETRVVDTDAGNDAPPARGVRPDGTWTP